MKGQAIYALSSDGEMLASGGEDGTVRIWDVFSGKELLLFEGKHSGCVISLVFSHDKQMLASIGSDYDVKLWMVKDGREYALEDSLNSGTAYTAASFSQDGSILAAGDNAYTLTGWDLTTGAAVAPLVGGLLEDMLKGKGGDTQKGYNVTAIAFSPKENLVASGGSDGWVRVWDIQILKLIKKRKLHRDSVTSLAFSPDGKTLVSGGGGLDASIQLWKIHDKKKPLHLKGHRTGVLSVAFSHNGLEVLSGGEDHLVKLWDVRTGEELAIFKGYSKDVCSVAFTKNMIASVSLDGRIKLYLTATDEEVARQRNK